MFSIFVGKLKEQIFTKKFFFCLFGIFLFVFCVKKISNQSNFIKLAQIIDKPQPSSSKWTTSAFHIHSQAAVCFNIKNQQRTWTMKFPSFNFSFKYKILSLYSLLSVDSLKYSLQVVICMVHISNCDNYGA